MYFSHVAEKNNRLSQIKVLSVCDYSSDGQTDRQTDRATDRPTDRRAKSVNVRC